MDNQFVALGVMLLTLGGWSVFVYSVGARRSKPQKISAVAQCLDRMQKGEEVELDGVGYAVLWDCPGINEIKSHALKLFVRCGDHVTELGTILPKYETSDMTVTDFIGLAEESLRPSVNIGYAVRLPDDATGGL